MLQAQQLPRMSIPWPVRWPNPAVLPLVPGLRLLEQVA